jgi:hypothetical protein
VKRYNFLLHFCTFSILLLVEDLDNRGKFGKDIPNSV